MIFVQVYLLYFTFASMLIQITQNPMKYIFTFLFLLNVSLFAQKDFSSQWQDLFSYNDVKDFTIVDNKIYVVSTNAMFVYDTSTGEIQKISSVNGLSGTEISSISSDAISKSVIIGHTDGLVEVVNPKNKVIPITGINKNLVLVDKTVNGFYRNKNNSYIYGGFGVVEFDVDRLEFQSSYKLSTTDTPTLVNQLAIFNDRLYAATTQGLYSISISESNVPNPINFANWRLEVNRNIENLVVANNTLIYAFGTDVFSVNDNSNALVNESQEILNLSFDNSLVVTTKDLISQYDQDYALLNQIDLSLATNYTFTTTKGRLLGENLYVTSSTFGILSTALQGANKNKYQEIHPEGPSANDAFTITVANNQKWVVYGGYTSTFDGVGKRRGMDIFDGEKWRTLSVSEAGGAQDITRVVIDPFDNTKALAGNYFRGVNEFSEFNFEKTWTPTNTLGVLPSHNETPLSNLQFQWVSDIIIDNNNMIWVGTSRARDNKVFGMYDGRKSGADRWVQAVQFPRFEYNRGVLKGLSKMSVDKNNNIFAGSRFNGLLVFNANPVANEADRKIAVLNNLEGKGSLSSNKVLAVVADENEKVWIGTDQGLVVFDDYENLYSETKQPARQVIIEEEEDARVFLGDTQINDILIDLSGNKYFATANSGVVYTSSDAQKTFNVFNTSNSPLPSNIVLDLELEKETGSVYMVTDKGIVVFDNNSDPFGNNITSVVAYPNPSIKNQIGHDEITIVAKDGNGIPDGTNVKIVDVSGRLVYETNVLNNGQSQEGGKVVWDKKNLRGKLVASGVYIVLLSNVDGSENTSTKIAIVN